MEIAKPLSLTELQRYVEWLESDRGFDQQTILHKCLLLGEEVGELFKAVRKSSGLAVDSDSDSHEIADELAVSLSTARFHVSTILSKLGATNRAEAAALAVKHRLVS